MLERTVERHLVTKTAQAGGLAVKHVSPGRAGDPDRLVVVPRRSRCEHCGSAVHVALVEVKAPGEQLRPLQAARIEEYQRLGLAAGWVSSIAGVDALIAGMREA